MPSRPHRPDPNQLDLGIVLDSLASRDEPSSRPRPQSLRTLPPVLDVETAARLLGIGRTTAYKIIADGSWPTPVLRLGTAIRLPTAPLLALLGWSTT